MKYNPKMFLVTLVVVAIALAAISASVFVFNAITSVSQSPAVSGTSSNNNGNNWMTDNQYGNMMGMMGGNWVQSSTPLPGARATQNSILPLIGFLTLIGAALTGTGGAAYYFMGRPKLFATPTSSQSLVNTTSIAAETPYDSVSKTLTVDERKVVDVLTKHKGEYLQKYLRTETGLSRLQIHRIVTRLAERGIVTLEQSGNTNKVYLSSWLAKQPFSKIDSKEKNAEQEMVIEA